MNCVNSSLTVMKAVWGNMEGKVEDVPSKSNTWSNAVLVLVATTQGLHQV